jgi:hypothetical protein
LPFLAHSSWPTIAKQRIESQNKWTTWKTIIQELRVAKEKEQQDAIERDGIER